MEIGPQNHNGDSLLGHTAIIVVYMGGCQNYGPVLGPYYNTAPTIFGTQKGTIILTTTRMDPLGSIFIKKPDVVFNVAIPKRVLPLLTSRV